MKKREKEGDTGRKGEEYGGETEKKKGERNRERREEVEGSRQSEGVITLVCLPLIAKILQVWL